MKLIDFDGLFDKKLSDFMEENAGKYTEKQWESIVPKMYRKFGDTYLAIAGDTPKGFYEKQTDSELCTSLKLHLEKEIPVSDFLCRELEKRGCPDQLLPLMESENEQLVLFAINLAGSAEKAFPAYFRIIKESEDVELKDTATEQLKGNADGAKEMALAYFHEGIEGELMLEILSRCKSRDERIFTLLAEQFRLAEEEVSLRASYLASYGDERALPILLERIDREDINFLEFTELKYAIEALGGRYDKERDFSSDPYFQEVVEQSQIMPDFTTKGKTEA